MAQTTRKEADQDPRLTPNANWQDPDTHIYARGFGERLRKALRGREKTREQLATALEIRTNYVQAWVSGRRLPSLPMLPRLCQELNVDAHWLLGLDRDFNTLGSLPDVLPTRFSINDAAEELDAAGDQYMRMAKEAWRLATMRRLSDRMILTD